jgi:hypothetical protein
VNAAKPSAFPVTRLSIVLFASVFISFVLLCAGFLIVLSGFGYDLIYAGIPYQDPTSEMEARFRADKAIADRIMLIGFIVGAIGFLWLILFSIGTWVRRSQKMS